MTDHKIFELGDVDLQCGLRLRGAQLAYQTYGELNAHRTPSSCSPPSSGRSTRQMSR